AGAAQERGTRQPKHPGGRAARGDRPGGQGIDPMTRPFYLTTAIDYANGDPHLGHALEKIGADVIARWHRLRGEPVHFLMGMDEHGQKVLQSAEAAGVDPMKWTDQISERFESTWRRLHCSHDDWMRT